MSEPKKIIWDLEFKASNTYKGDLRAAPGFIFCFGWKEVGKGKAQTITILDYPGKNAIDDSKLVKEIYNVLKDADLHIFHYGTQCDWKFIQTRLLKHGYDLLKSRPAVFDTYQVARKYLSIKSNSLKSLAYFFGLKESKMEIVEDIWMLANAGDPASIKRIAKRCESDVRLTEEVYMKLLPLAENHPAIYKIQKMEEGLYTTPPAQCQSCGGTKITSNGYSATAKSLLQRYRCWGCGSSVYLPVPAKEHKNL